ncbi:3-isopropylmalate dehydratase small subunit, partial [Bacillus sp. JJ1521]
KEANDANFECTISLEEQTIVDSKGFKTEFSIDSHWKEMLINGWDEIDKTLYYEEQIKEHELKTAN